MSETIFNAARLTPDDPTPVPARYQTIVFDHPGQVKITMARWEVTLTITDATGREHVYYASADGALTWGDGIWLGSAADREEALK